MTREKTRLFIGWESYYMMLAPIRRLRSRFFPPLALATCIRPPGISSAEPFRRSGTGTGAAADFYLENIQSLRMGTDG